MPQDLPDPRSPAIFRRPRARLSKLLMHSRGRAFVLFTSYQQMRLMYDRVSLEIPYQTLLQGTGPRSALLEDSAPPAMRFCLRLRRFGKAWTCRASS